jgi:hypothetical protein
MSNENVNDINSPVQTNENEEGEAIMDTIEQNRKIDSGEKSDESSTNVYASYSCEECGEKFGSRQELKEHTQVH